MTDMNNSINEIYTKKPAQTAFASAKGEPAPICDCPKCEEETKQTTDLKKDPREVIGRSQVQKRTLDPETMAAIQESLGDLESLQDIREELIKGNIKAGYPKEIAQQLADEIILDTFCPVN